MTIINVKPINLSVIKIMLYTNNRIATKCVSKAACMWSHFESGRMEAWGRPEKGKFTKQPKSKAGAAVL